MAAAAVHRLPVRPHRGRHDAARCERRREPGHQRRPHAATSPACTAAPTRSPEAARREGRREPGSQGDGLTPLYIACEHGRTEVVTTLLAAGARAEQNLAAAPDALPPGGRVNAHLRFSEESDSDDDEEEVKGSLPAKPTPATAARLRRAWFRLRRAGAAGVEGVAGVATGVCAAAAGGDALEARLVKEEEMAEAAVAPKTAPSRRRRPGSTRRRRAGASSSSASSEWKHDGGGAADGRRVNIMLKANESE